jgi:pyruvate/2-oxoacid:ferredoxin oxidoreductase beta subunit
MAGTAGLSRDLPAEELLHSGHAACSGCGAALALRLTLKGLSRRTILVAPASCTTPISGVFPFSALRVPLMHTAFETGGAAGSGVRAALEMKGVKDLNVVVWAGDGGTFDIGLQSLSGAAERNEDLIYVCYDNEAYMNTGIQRSSATPLGSWTTTTPVGAAKVQPKKDIMGLMAAHEIPYAATAAPAFPRDLVEKMKRAAGIKGFRFFHILAPCPTGWRTPPELTVKLSRLAVETRVFPLYEIINGRDYALSQDPAQRPVQDYLKLQGRFKHLTKDELAAIQDRIDDGWQRLSARFRD